ncbi:hypothetical protein ASG31_00340 [Chryseobacterium sp. Leaf404]|uniref:DUF6624 domain-containing protein n=1 Tax=unclassified Chryseobacterium TaxID=2593645 RepID=UPI000712FF4E|nr:MULTISPECIES: DUF6624 domain-containing protein [unclassified Chryseobacterium]KQT21830.1 hypothetical protein ASG31_00340 [Chryseobacterium sp. Leaf404]
MKYLVTFVLVFFLSFVNAQQQGINENLKKELDEILRLDQTYRRLFDNDITAEKKSEILKELNIDEKDFEEKQWQLVVDIDTLNMRKIDKIISQYGYPGKSLVGEPTNRSAWYVIQHSNKIGKYLPIIKNAGKQKEIPFTLAAMMEDRFLMNSGKEQIYGTQGAGEFFINKDGKEDFVNFIWPIKNEKNVNKLRKETGFKNTIEENAKDMFGKDFVYKPFSLKKALKLRKQASNIQ